MRTFLINLDERINTFGPANSLLYPFYGEESLINIDGRKKSISEIINIVKLEVMNMMAEKWQVVIILDLFAEESSFVNTLNEINKSYKEHFTGSNIKPEKTYILASNYTGSDFKDMPMEPVARYYLELASNGYVNVNCIRIDEIQKYQKMTDDFFSQIKKDKKFEGELYKSFKNCHPDIKIIISNKMDEITSLMERELITPKIEAILKKYPPETEDACTKDAEVIRKIFDDFKEELPNGLNDYVISNLETSGAFTEIFTDYCIKNKFYFENFFTSEELKKIDEMYASFNISLRDQILTDLSQDIKEKISERFEKTGLYFTQLCDEKVKSIEYLTTKKGKKTSIYHDTMLMKKTGEDFLKTIEKVKNNYLANADKMEMYKPSKDLRKELYNNYGMGLVAYDNFIIFHNKIRLKPDKAFMTDLTKMVYLIMYLAEVDGNGVNLSSKQGQIPVYKFSARFDTGLFDIVSERYQKTLREEIEKMPGEKTSEKRVPFYVLETEEFITPGEIGFSSKEIKEILEDEDTSFDKAISSKLKNYFMQYENEMKKYYSSRIRLKNEEFVNIREEKLKRESEHEKAKEKIINAIKDKPDFDPYEYVKISEKIKIINEIRSFFSIKSGKKEYLIAIIIFTILFNIFGLINSPYRNQGIGTNLIFTFLITTILAGIGSAFVNMIFIDDYRKELNNEMSIIASKLSQYYKSKFNYLKYLNEVKITGYNLERVMEVYEEYENEMEQINYHLNSMTMHMDQITTLSGILKQINSEENYTPEKFTGKIILPQNLEFHPALPEKINRIYYPLTYVPNETGRKIRIDNQKELNSEKIFACTHIEIIESRINPKKIEEGYA